MLSGTDTKIIKYLAWRYFLSKEKKRYILDVLKNGIEIKMTSCS